MSDYVQINNKNVDQKQIKRRVKYTSNTICIDEYKARKLKSENRQALNNIMKSVEELDW